MLSSQVRRFGEMLVERHVLSRDDFEAALEESTQSGAPLPAVLRTRGLVMEKDLTAAIAHTVGLRFVDFQDAPINPDAAEMIPAGYARKFNAIGVGFEDRKLVVAFAEPDDDEALTAIGGITGYEIIPAAADRTELLHAIDMVFGGAEGGSDAATATPTDENATEIEKASRDQMLVTELLERVLELRGSDLHLTSGAHPIVRVNGDLRPMTDFPVLNGSQIRQMVFAILTQKQREKFEQELELDTSYSMPGRSRFRVNVFLQRDSVGAVMRVIPYKIVGFEDLGVPDVVRSFSHLPRGLILVTGPTGSGKSTTLASLIDIVNTSKPVHIMTVEDPIEFLHQHKTAIVNQREVGEDTQSFSNALRHVLRQDPDVILVGEMRDLETISTALTAAETGHLVFATLHTQDAPQSIDRVIDVFPAHQQQQIRVQLASSLQGIVTQQLLPTADGMGRVAAAEVLVATAAIRNLIREAKVHQIPSIMQAGGKYGMVTMDQSLAKLVRQGKITMDLAVERCAHEEELRRLVQSLG